MLGALVLVAAGSFLMTNLRAETDYLVLSAWMLVLGLGVGPTLAVFTIVVQNAVPMAQLGAATSSLTFFRQIGGSVGLAVAGSFFGSRIVTNITDGLTSAGVPPQLADQFSGSGFDRNALSAGVDLTATLTQAIQAAPIPDPFKEQALAFVPTIVDTFYQAMSITIGEVFWLGVGAAVLAFLASLFIAELPLRTTVDHRPPGAEPHVDAPPDRMPATLPVPSRALSTRRR
jgi:hypothetical protein